MLVGGSSGSGGRREAARPGLAGTPEGEDAVIVVLLPDSAAAT